MLNPFDNKKAEIWAEIKFIPADPNKKASFISTKKTKLQKITEKLKQIWRLLK